MISLNKAVFALVLSALGFSALPAAAQMHVVPMNILAPASECDRSRIGCTNGPIRSFDQPHQRYGARPQYGHAPHGRPQHAAPQCRHGIYMTPRGPQCRQPSGHHGVTSHGRSSVQARVTKKFKGTERVHKGTERVFAGRERVHVGTERVKVGTETTLRCSFAVNRATGERIVLAGSC